MDADYVDQLVQRGLISDDAAARLMTHRPEEPNPAQPYAQGALRALQTGLGFAQGGLQGAGVSLPDWMRSNPVQRAVQNPDNAAAMGMANPTPRIVGPVKAMVDEMIARGESKNTIAKAAGTGTATIGRYLASSGKKTAYGENPWGFWENNPGSEDQLREMAARKVPVPRIAETLGTNEDVVRRKLKLQRDAGEYPDYQPPGPSFWHPDSAPRRDRLEQLAGEGSSLSEMARDRQLGANGNPDLVSRWIKGMQDRYGKLKHWAPQSGQGTTAAARTPTVAQLKFMSRPAPDFDPSASRDWANALREFTAQGK